MTGNNDGPLHYPGRRDSIFPVGRLKTFQDGSTGADACIPFSVRSNQRDPGVTIPERNSKTKGDSTEAKVIYELISRGYGIAVPFGDNERYDLIIDDQGTLYRIQCKTAWETNSGTIRFNTHSQTTRDGEYLQTTYYGDIDAFVVWCPVNQCLYWVDIDEAPVSKMDLRYDAAIDHPSINWAADYELGEEIPGADR